jgi:UDP-N-acetylmuramoylalanine--D-glutamate ligase
MSETNETSDWKERGKEFAGQRVAVIGLAATGLATAKILRDLGAIVTVYDGKPAEKLDAERLAEAKNLDGVTLSLGVPEADWNATDLVIPSPGVPRYAPVLTEAVRRGVRILGEIEVAYRLAAAPILAITGTNGKTTTTALVGAICREAGLKTWVAGNIAEDAGKRLPLIQATIEAPADGVIVAEISSFQLEWVERFAPKVAAWLNIENDHLDRHKDFDEYARAKSNIFCAQTEDDYAVLNADDANVMRYSEGIGRGKRGVFRLEEATGYFVRNGFSVILQNGGLFAQHRLVSGGTGRFEVGDLLLKGRHNTANIMAAIGMTTALSIPLETIAAALKKFKGVAHRMEFVAQIGGVTYINNSMCTNPAALIASVSAIETPLVAIVGGIHKGGDLTKIGEALAKFARHVVFIGKSAPELAAALEAAGETPHEFAETLPNAVERTATIAQSGETVMLVPGCASFDMFTGFEQRGQVFRDAVHAIENRAGGE